MKTTILNTISLVILLSLTSSCITTISKDTEIHKTAKQDTEYYNTLMSVTKKKTIIVNFEKRFEINATYLSPMFRIAFSSRLKKIMLEDRYNFNESYSKIAFFVTLFTPNSNIENLRDEDHWNIILTVKGKKYKAQYIRALSDKEKWTTFFPYISNWTSEYLVVFETPTIEVKDSNKFSNPLLSLNFANASGKINLKW